MFSPHYGRQSSCKPIVLPLFPRSQPTTCQPETIRLPTYYSTTKWGIIICSYTCGFSSLWVRSICKLQH